MNNGKLFFKGIPTALDVEALMGRFGVPEEGALISYSDIESTIDVDRRMNRFKTVVKVWRKRLMREHNLLMHAIPGEGLRACTPQDRVSVSAKKAQSGRRAILRSSAIAASTDRSRLDEETQRVCDHLASLPKRLHLTELCAPKKLPPVAGMD